MAFNSREDVFHTGTSEGQPVLWLDPEQVKALPSGDYPGKSVGAVAHKKRNKSNYAGIKRKVRSGEVLPVTLHDGVLVDGHTRAAAHLALRRPMAVRETAAS